MVPVGARWVVDDEVVFVGGAWSDGVGGLAVLVLGDDESVPVNDAFLWEPVLECDPYPLTRVHVEGGSEVGAAWGHACRVAVDDLCSERVDVCGNAGCDLSGRGFRPEVQGQVAGLGLEFSW